MPRDVRLFLHEVREACDDVLRYAADRTLEDYLNDRQMRHAIERNLMIIGEALNQARRIDETIGERLPDLRGIVDFRNILIHGYYTVKHDIVWANIQREVGPLCETVECLLREYAGP